MTYTITTVISFDPDTEADAAATFQKQAHGFHEAEPTTAGGITFIKVDAMAAKIGKREESGE
jgi:hypothetical protein